MSMAEYKYGDNRYEIFYGSYTGVEQRGVDLLYGAVAPYLPYVLTVSDANQAEKQTLGSVNPICIGTVRSNPYIHLFVQRGLISLSAAAEGYVIKVCQNPFNPQKQMVIIAGSDENGVLYGALDFKAYVLPQAENNHWHSTYFDKLFAEKPLPEYEAESAPAIRQRGLWTWGHVIYDYRRYLQNMMYLKLNTLIVWNDHPPVNLREVISYAHQCGIKVICGYSWGWDCIGAQQPDISNPQVLDGIREHILETYRQNYSDLDIDGIYFQSFTETEEDSLNGVLIADAVVQLVNQVCETFFALYGEMELQFGLHATSVAKKLEYIAKTDPRVRIVWEDCGAFPYAYVPSQTQEFEKTLALTDQITALRGKQERIGMVLKGLTCLNWDEFEHQMGPFVMGQYPAEFICRRAMQKKDIWRYVTAYWLENLPYARQVVARIAKNTKGEAVVTALLEDGMLEHSIQLPAALISELLWNPDKPADELLRLAALRRDVCLQ